MLASHGNKEIIKIMRDKCMKITLRRVNSATCHIEENLHSDVCESSLVFLCCTTRIRELPVYSQNLRNDLQNYESFHNGECQTLLKNSIKMIKEEHFERDVDENLIKSMRKYFVDRNFTMHE